MKVIDELRMALDISASGGWYTVYTVMLVTSTLRVMKLEEVAVACVLVLPCGSFSRSSTVYRVGSVLSSEHLHIGRWRDQFCRLKVLGVGAVGSDSPQHLRCVFHVKNVVKTRVFSTS